MKLSFEGFLNKRCRKISGLETSSFRRLVPHAQETPSLRAPLFLLAAARGKEVHLMSLVWGTELEDEYRPLMRILRDKGSLEELIYDKRTPDAYKQLHRDFQHLSRPNVLERQAMERLRTRTVSALEAAGITRYRLCKDLKLDPGNVYSYLSGNLDKVSAETAQRIYDYAHQLSSAIQERKEPEHTAENNVK